MHDLMNIEFFQHLIILYLDNISFLPIKPNRKRIQEECQRLCQIRKVRSEHLPSSSLCKHTDFLFFSHTVTPQYLVLQFVSQIKNTLREIKTKTKERRQKNNNKNKKKNRPKYCKLYVLIFS